MLECLTAIWGASDFTCDGYGGDFVLPGAVEYQRLHSDGGFNIAVQGGGTIDTRKMGA